MCCDVKLVYNAYKYFKLRTPAFTYNHNLSLPVSVSLQKMKSVKTLFKPSFALFSSVNLKLVTNLPAIAMDILQV